MAVKAPTREDLIKTVKTEFGLEDFAMKAEDIDDEMYEKCIKGYEKGLNIRSMANRLRFQSVGGTQKEGATYETTEGFIVGSKDIATQKNPLGKNKVMALGMLVEGDDGKLRVVSEPNCPSHFKGFKSKYYGKHIEAEMEYTSNGTGQYVSPHKISIIDDLELDLSSVVAVDNNGLLNVEEYKPVAIVGTIGSLREARIAAWDRDDYPELEDYPMFDKKGHPTFMVYLHAEEGEPVVKVQFGPTHLAQHTVELEDFDILWDPEDVEDVREEVSPAFAGRRVLIIGQRRKDSDSDEVTFIDVEGFAIYELADDVEPIVEEPENKAKAAKAKGGKAAGKALDKPEKKTPAQKKAEMAEKQKAVRKGYVEKVVEAMQAETTVEVVRKMVSGPAFKNVDDDYIQGLIDEIFEEQGLEAGEAEASEEPEEKPAKPSKPAKGKGKPAKKAEPEPEEEEEESEEDDTEEEEESETEEEDDDDIFGDE